MGLFGFGKKDKILDLTENYKRQVEKAEKARALQKNSSSAGAGPFSFFDSPAAIDSISISQILLTSFFFSRTSSLCCK